MCVRNGSYRGHTGGAKLNSVRQTRVRVIGCVRPPGNVGRVYGGVRACSMALLNGGIMLHKRMHMHAQIDKGENIKELPPWAHTRR